MDRKYPIVKNFDYTDGDLHLFENSCQPKR